MSIQRYLIVHRAPRQIGVNLFFIALLLLSVASGGGRGSWETMGMLAFLLVLHCIQVFAPTIACWAAIMTAWSALEIYVVIAFVRSVEGWYLFLLLIPALLAWSKPRPPDYEDEPEINPDTRRHR